jgi:hypothetical protein
VNYQKSNIYPVNVELEKMEILAQTFGRQIGSYTFTYLGLPLRLNKAMIEDMLVERIERRLGSTSNFLTQEGRLKVVNFVLSTLPTFHTLTWPKDWGLNLKFEKSTRHDKVGYQISMPQYIIINQCCFGWTPWKSLEICQRRNGILEI